MEDYSRVFIGTYDFSVHNAINVALPYEMIYVVLRRYRPKDVRHLSTEESYDGVSDLCSCGKDAHTPSNRDAHTTPIASHCQYLDHPLLTSSGLDIKVFRCLFHERLVKRAATDFHDIVVGIAAVNGVPSMFATRALLIASALTVG